MNKWRWVDTDIDRLYHTVQYMYHTICPLIHIHTHYVYYTYIYRERDAYIVLKKKTYNNFLN